ncbi:MAG: hypothetical protein JWL80_575 [Parcubacteria group bacterium]|nr:hypothetical protein [Parcubacteria group bacterium]
MKKIGASLIVFLFPLALFAYTSPGKPTGYVNDFAGILKPETVTFLNTELTTFAAQTTSEISVATVPDITGETIETYAVKLFKEWGIGTEKKDNGVLLLIAPNEKEVRIEVGYGLEPAITDIESAHIISEVIVPAFQAGDYDSGVVGAVQRLEKDAAKEFPVAEYTAPQTRDYSFLGRLMYPFIFFLVVLGSYLGRSKSWWLGGVIGGVVGIALFIFLGVTIGIISLIILIPLGLLFDFLVSRHGGNGKGPFPPFFMGGGRGFGGGGGFGGFGGGMSGGGGASGKW